MRNPTWVILVSYLSFLVFVLVCTFLEVVQRADLREQTISAKLAFSNEKIKDLEHKIALDATIPAIPGTKVYLSWPIHPDDYKRKTSPIGRRAPIAGGQCIIHRGLDLVGLWHARIVASLDGKISDFGKDPIKGNFLEIKHDHGLKTRYYHLSEIYPEYKQIGATVKTGEVLGRQGNTGFSDRDHLHFEVLKQERQENPLRFLPEDPR